MDYDFEVHADDWFDLRFEYRVVYSLGAMRPQAWNGTLGQWVMRGQPGFPIEQEEQLLNSNYQKIRDHMMQLHTPDHYCLHRTSGILFIYCNEWIEEAILKLACPDDQHFLNPAYVERLNENKQV